MKKLVLLFLFLAAAPVSAQVPAMRNIRDTPATNPSTVDMVPSWDGSSFVWKVPTIPPATSAKLNDDIVLTFGTSDDVSLVYSTADGLFTLISGTTPGSNQIMYFNPDGRIGVGAPSGNNVLNVDAVGLGTRDALNIELASGHSGNAFEINTDTTTTGDLFKIDATGHITPVSFESVVLKDDKVISFGTGTDVSFAWSNTDGLFELVSGNTPGSNVLQYWNKDGRIGIGATSGNNVLNIDGVVGASRDVLNIELASGHSGNALEINTDGVVTGDLLRVTATGAMRIAGAYTLPIVDGIAGQQLQTDGAGTVTWETNESLWTDAGAVTHLTSLTDDLAIGAADNTGPFFFDEGLGQLRIGGTGAPGGALDTSGTYTASSGTDIHATLTPTYNQTLTAGSTDFLINRTETALGSGSHYFMDLQVGGTSEVALTNTGDFELANANTLKWKDNGGTLRDVITLTSGNIIYVNGDKQDFDFQVDTDTNSNTLFVWGSEDRVGVYDSTPDAMLDVVAHASTEIGLIVEGAAAQSANLFEINTNGGSGGDLLEFESDGHLIISSGTANQTISFDPDETKHVNIASTTSHASRNVGMTLVNASTSVTWGMAHEYSKDAFVISNTNADNTSFISAGDVQFIFAADGMTASSGTEAAFEITPTYNQTSTANSTDFLINRTETALGSGSHNFIDLQVASSSKFLINNTGATRIGGTGAPGAMLDVGAASATDVGQIIELAATPSANAFEINTNSGSGGDIFLVAADGDVTIPALKNLSMGTRLILNGSSRSINTDAHSGLRIQDTVATNATPALVALNFGSIFNASSGAQVATSITPEYRQTSTAGSTDLLINRTETTLGSGAHNFVDLQVGGTSQFSIANDGAVSASGVMAIGKAVTTPSQTLDVYQGAANSVIRVQSVTDNATLSLSAGSTGGGEEAQINFLQGGATKWKTGMMTDDHFELFDFTRNGVVMEFEDNGNLALMESGGRVGIGLGSPVGTLHVDQNSASGVIPVISLTQTDIDDVFINFIGTSAADGTRSISSDTTEDSTKYGAIRIEINGVTKWIRVYDDES